MVVLGYQFHGQYPRSKESPPFNSWKYFEFHRPVAETVCILTNSFLAYETKNRIQDYKAPRMNSILKEGMI